jgi:hypothetical protein
LLAMLRTRLTYANVVATLALFVALGGSSYAAITVTGKNVKNGSLTGADVKNSSLTSSDVKNRSLLSQDFKSGQLPAGQQGAQGSKGDKGDQGPSGVLSTHAFGGTIGTITGSGSGIGDWQFAGPTSAGTIATGQRITATAAIALGAPGSTTVAVNSDVCFQPLGGSPTPIGNHLTTAVSTRQDLSATATFIPAPGFYTIGACVAIPTGQSLDNNNVTDGWFIVTN